MDWDGLKYLLALKEIPGVGNILAKMLIQEAGSAREVFRMPIGKLLKLPKLSEKSAKEIIHFKNFDRIETEIAYCDKESIRILPYFDKDYPSRLLQCHDAPLLLYQKGNANLNASKMVAIVGTRNSTDYGKQVTECIIDTLQPHQATIISGLALGIDGIAHRKSINSHLPTIAVLGHSLSQIYPRQHYALAQQILANGAWVSEYSIHSSFDRNNFPMRNRIVAGMCDAVILIESARKGGAMITAEIAHSYGREVYAVPGKWTDIHSQGPNHLIKTFKAHILTKPDDLAEDLGWQIKQQLIIDTFYDRKLTLQQLEGDELKIATSMDFNESYPIDTIHYATGIPIHKLSSVLLSMEFKGILKALPGKRFQLR